MHSQLLVKTITDRAAWETFLTQAAPHSFLHSWQWGESHNQTNTSTIRYGVYADETLTAVALIIDTKARRGRFLFCPHGPVMLPTTPAETILALLTDELKKEARRRAALFIRISPLMPRTTDNEALYRRLGYRNAPIHMAHPELAWILDVRPSEEALLAGMRKSTRYSIKKAQKDGVVVRMSTDPGDLERFWQVYQTTVARQQFAPFSKEYLLREFTAFASTGQAAFFFATYRDTITAAACIIFDAHSGYYHHGATTQQFPGLTDAQLLQWEIIREVRRRGLSFYNFWGVVPEQARRHPWAGLSTFKRGFGGAEEAYLHAQDLPLSPKYWITYMIEKLRRLWRGL